MSDLLSVDAHASGGSCRVVHAGVPTLQGNDAAGRRRYFQTELDWVRSLLMHAPRGHPGEFGAVLARPIRKTSEYSVIFFDPAGYLDACGHGTLCTVAVWQRMKGDLRTPFNIDNPDGSVTRVLRAAGSSTWCAMTLELPSATVVRDHWILPWKRRLPASTVQCGNLYIVVDGTELDWDGELGVDGSDMRRHMLREILEAAGDMIRPELGRSPEVLIYRRLDDSDEFETSVLFNGTQLDSSPCGTGSGALAALLHSRGELGEDRSISTYGPMALPFRVAVESEIAQERYKVRLSGEAFVTGVHEWIRDERDPLPQGVSHRRAASQTANRL